MTAHYPGRAAIETYGAGGFGFAGMSHRGSILALPSGIYAWRADPRALSPADFDMAIAEKAGIDLLLIGMGAVMARPPKPVRAALEAAGLMYDPMATGHAVSTYNLLLEEKRRVAAAFIAVDFSA
ncbi:MTH938/NDUFAF3 family protein [Aestuariivirga sp.]|uniref:Mth938-like domain-containing protein n=1 Tax=Aestuariivirga sp. TaxID=2650926 RepID=UPI0025C1C18F|nr:MTH938/NDUFAF3 family protein [Aestuariivirga sp.]